jgi:hypothetical protein
MVRLGIHYQGVLMINVTAMSDLPTVIPAKAGTQTGRIAS